MNEVDMNKHLNLTVELFDPKETLVALFESKGIEFEYKAKNPAIKIAQDQRLEVLGDLNDTAHALRLAAIFVEWLDDSEQRKIQAQMLDCTIIYLNDLSVDEVAGILKYTFKVIAFDLEYNNAITRNSERLG